MLSADSHICEPPQLWRDRLDRRLRDRAPRVVRDLTGKPGDWFVCEGVEPRSVFAAFAAGVPAEELRDRSRRGFDAAPPSIWDPGARLKDQDVDGVSGEVLYPTMTDLVFGIADPVLRSACLKAYNDHVAEYCGPHPDRLAGIGVVDLDEPSTAVTEIERCLRLGLRGVVIRGDPAQDLGYERRDLDRFWAAAVAANIPVTLHRSAVRKDVSSDVLGALVEYTLIPQQAQRLLTGMLLSGVWDARPREACNSPTII